MKALKIIGIILLVIIVLIVILGLVAPKEYLVERTILINAPQALVFDQVKYFKNQNKWSPWKELDPAMTTSIEGKDGEVGAVYKWTGDLKKSGIGEMINTGIKEGEETTYHLKFIEPMASEADGYTRLTLEEGGVKVAWGFTGKSPFPWNVMTLFMNMDKMLGKDFERGLQILKDLCEKEAEMMAKYQVQIVDYPAKSFAGIQQTVAFAEIHNFFMQSFDKIGQAVKANRKCKVMGAPAGLYYSWDETAMTADMAAAFPIKGAITNDEIKMIEVPAGKAAMVEYIGPYSQSMAAYQALDYYLKSNNLTHKLPIIEEYMTDPMTEPDSAKWLTYIYYLTE